jgi:hypothetical protein
VVPFDIGDVFLICAKDSSGQRNPREWIVHYRQRKCAIDYIFLIAPDDRAYVGVAWIKEVSGWNIFWYIFAVWLLDRMTRDVSWLATGLTILGNWIGQRADCKDRLDCKREPAIPKVILRKI